MWPFRKLPSPVAKEIADEFERGRLVKTDVSPRSISELGVSYRGHPVLVTWYPAFIGGRRLRTISVDGSEAVFPSSVDADHIFRAALRRADRLFDEKMAWLEARRAYTS